MGWEASNCCCCISVRTGTMLLGFFTLLGLLNEINEFIPIRLAANGIVSVAFLLMVMDDTEGKRKLFFYCYAICTVIMYFFGIYVANERLQESKKWVEICDDMNRKGQMQDFHTSTLAECQDKMKAIINTAVTIMFALALAVQCHFIAVIYAHFKNYGKDHGDRNERTRLQDETV